MPTLRNPVLRGFNPDPSIVRVGDDYYLATSTFEFHPAVRLHHSTNLVDWTVVGHALGDGFELLGIPDSGGVWAPSLSYIDGRFWLAYSVVRTMDGDDKDIDNYLITADDIAGAWSEPVHLGSRGFDFSFFHDPDGTHWIVGVQWDQRPEHPSFSGIVLEQYLPDERRTSGAPIIIHREEGLIEGPNLYVVDGRYHLLLAVGGTGWNHGVAVTSADRREGPYAPALADTVLTTRDAPGHPLQKAGHGELVQDPLGRWWMAHLASRPTLHLGERYSTLGRETCLQRVDFSGGRLRLADGGRLPSVEIEVGVEGDASDQVRADPGAARGWSDDFDGPIDTRRWSTLRAALAPGVIDLDARPGWLRLAGGHSPGSVFAQSMLLTRVEEHRTVAETVIDAEPRSTRELTGLIAWYDRAGWIWLQLGWDPDNGRHLRVVRRDDRTTTRSAAITVPDGPLRLRACLDGPHLRFSFAPVDGGDWTDVPGTYPAWTLSDDHGPRLRFTGMFLGIRADDLDGRGWSADFDRFELRSDPV